MLENPDSYYPLVSGAISQAPHLYRVRALGWFSSFLFTPLSFSFSERARSSFSLFPSHKGSGLVTAEDPLTLHILVRDYGTVIVYYLHFFLSFHPSSSEGIECPPSILERRNLKIQLLCFHLPYTPTAQLWNKPATRRIITFAFHLSISLDAFELVFSQASPRPFILYYPLHSIATYVLYKVIYRTVIYLLRTTVTDRHYTYSGSQ